MTETRAWDGRPPNPEQDGWHWVHWMGEKEPVAAQWVARRGHWIWPGESETLGAGWIAPQARYVAPCPPPAAPCADEVEVVARAIFQCGLPHTTWGEVSGIYAGAALAALAPLRQAERERAWRESAEATRSARGRRGGTRGSRAGRCDAGVSAAADGRGVIMAKLTRASVDHPSQVTDEILLERIRQIEREGYTTDHDDDHDEGALANAAAVYAVLHTDAGTERLINEVWPWERLWLKPQDARRNLIKAAALIVAEIERLDRVGGRAP